MTTTIFTFLDSVRERPSMFFADDDLVALENMVWGYYAGIRLRGIVENVPEMTGHFLIWLRETKRWGTNRGWARAIQEHAKKRPPLEVFFELVDRYRALSPVTLCSTKLGRKNAPTGKRVVIGMNGRMQRPDAVDIVRYAPTRIHFLRFHYGKHKQNDWPLMDGRGSHATSLRFAKRWVADELQTTDADWVSRLST